MWEAGDRGVGNRGKQKKMEHHNLNVEFSGLREKKNRNLNPIYLHLMKLGERVSDPENHNKQN